jgi:hypothetical protein
LKENPRNIQIPYVHLVVSHGLSHELPKTTRTGQTRRTKNPVNTGF